MPDVATGWILLVVVVQLCIAILGGVSLVWNELRITSDKEPEEPRRRTIGEERHVQRRIRSMWIGYTGGKCPHCGESFGVEGEYQESTPKERE